MAWMRKSSRFSTKHSVKSHFFTGDRSYCGSVTKDPSWIEEIYYSRNDCQRCTSVLINLGDTLDDGFNLDF